MVKNSIFILLIFYTLFSQAECSNLVLVFFNDKNNSSNIDDEVSFKYIQEIEDIGLEYINASKWLNVAIFKYVDVDKIEQLKKLPFIHKIEFGCVESNYRLEKYRDENIKLIENYQFRTDDDTIFIPQITQLKGEFLQNKAYKGQGIKIAVIDNGFPNANNIQGLQHIYNENRLLGTYDFYNNSTNVYFPSSSNHGTNCLSIIGGLLSNFSGAAPNASFYLYRTEVDAIEGQTEEVLLSSALEKAYENGVKIVSISLGYTNGFDDGTKNHTYAELNGKTTIAAKAVNIAASKGILVCVSAGNEGSRSWKYISTPADADSAFTIGAVDANGNIASFTSYQFDTAIAIKPNVAAQGVGTQLLNGSNTISTGNGTSYAAPIIAGLSACLWQAFPTNSNWEIKTAIEQSAHLYTSPNKRIGFGIPNFQKAYEILEAINQKIEGIKIYPTIFNDYINFISNDVIHNIKIFTLDGKLILDKNVHAKSTSISELNSLPNNMYVIRIKTNNGTICKKVIKQ